MNFALNPEQELLRDSVRTFLERKSPEERVRRVMQEPRGFDEALWGLMARDLGLMGLVIPEEFGGFGASFVELGVVLEEMGRALVPSPYFATTVLATHALLLCGDADAKRDFLPPIAVGESVATLAFADPAASLDGLRPARGRSVDGSWLLEGSKAFVLDGHVADVVLVVAPTGAGPSLFAVCGDAAGFTWDPLLVMDETRRHVTVHFENTPARLIGVEGAAAQIVSHVLDLAAVGLAAEQVGGAQRCLEMSVEYAKLRTQFGRSIASFQAIKHKCANVMLDVEAARSTSIYALFAAADGAEDLPAIASMTKAFCSDAYANAALENIQIHGAIGFTWDHAAQLYFKRSRSSGQWLGRSAHHREALAARIGL